MKGILFDFNGTMFPDTPFHIAAWRRIIREFFGKEMDDAEYWSRFHGTPNVDILSILSGGAMPLAQRMEISDLKEVYYREECLRRPEAFHLAKGLPQLLDALCAKGVPMAIGTSVGLVNLEFYMPHLHVTDWIPMERIVYQDGTRPGKPDPAVFLEAARRIGVAPEDCVGFEDSLMGLRALRSAGTGRICFVDCDDQSALICQEFPDVMTIRDYADAAPKTFGF